MTAKNSRPADAHSRAAQAFYGASSSVGTPTPVGEPTAWLRGRLAARERQLAALVAASSHCLVVAALRPELLDRQCDRCEASVPLDEPLHGLTSHVRPRLMLVTGLCDRCARLELVAGDSA